MAQKKYSPYKLNTILLSIISCLLSLLLLLITYVWNDHSKQIKISNDNTTALLKQITKDVDDNENNIIILQTNSLTQVSKINRLSLDLDGIKDDVYNIKSIVR